MKEEKLIEVCDKCKRASCWYGEFMCDEAQNAGTIRLTIKELRKLDLEDESYWSDEKLLEVYGTKNPAMPKPKERRRIYYEVDYIPTQEWVKISDLMSAMDLGIEKIYTTDIFSWSTTAKIDKKYIAKMKKALKFAIEKQGGEAIKITYKSHE